MGDVKFYLTKIKMSLLLKVSLAIVAISMVAGLVSGFISYIEARERVEIKAQSEADTMVSAISAISENLDSIESIQRSITALASDRTVNSINLVDLEKRVIAASSHSKWINQAPGPEIFPNEILSALATGKEAEDALIFDAANGLWTVRFVSLEGIGDQQFRAYGLNRAAVVLELDASHLREMQRTNLPSVFLRSSIPVVVFGLIVIWYLSMYLLRPLQAVRETLAKRTHGDASAFVRIKGGGEIHQMASELDRMLAAMDATYLALGRAAKLLIIDRELKILDANEKFLSFFGLHREQAIGQSWMQLVFGEELPAIARDIVNLTEKSEFWSQELHFKKGGSGQEVWLDTFVSAIVGEDGQIERYLAIQLDATEKRMAEIKLVNSAKMASLGEMAGAVAHEINNPLAIIKGKAAQARDLLATEPDRTGELVDFLSKIELTADRIARIVKGLRFVSRQSEHDPMMQTQLRTIIDDTLELCRDRFRNQGVELRLNPIPNIRLSCRAAQISQVLLNLISNALDAIESLNEKWIQIEVHQFDHKLQIFVTDSGGGIKPDIVNRMMHPFFTTKQVGRGTGLGLSISQGIIESHHGRLFYDSLSFNTRFVIELPIDNSLPAGP